ncbi:MAG: alpha/beta fold hydrolase [Bacteroidota bacterium]
MRRLLTATMMVLLTGSVAAQPALPDEPEAECVVLLHGLNRSERAMRPVKRFLEDQGYRVVNESYDSRSKRLPAIAEETVPARIEQCGTAGAVHFVTHSMGGIVVRQYAELYGPARIGRVVMLAPPNQGSELVDRMRLVPLYDEILGRAGRQLGTDSTGVPVQLGPVQFETGVIAGNRSLTPFYSWIIPGKDDGKVSVDRARVEGMADFLEVRENHTFLMRSEPVLAQTLHFLRHGAFDQ